MALWLQRLRIPSSSNNGQRILQQPMQQRQKDQYLKEEVYGH